MGESVANLAGRGPGPQVGVPVREEVSRTTYSPARPAGTRARRLPSISRGRPGVHGERGLHAVQFACGLPGRRSRPSRARVAGSPAVTEPTWRVPAGPGYSASITVPRRAARLSAARSGCRRPPPGAPTGAGRRDQQPWQGRDGDRWVAAEQCAIATLPNVNRSSGMVRPGRLRANRRNDRRIRAAERAWSGGLHHVLRR